jgi:hypothetical protein
LVAMVIPDSVECCVMLTSLAPLLQLK